jgi:hypothetical protein
MGRKRIKKKDSVMPFRETVAYRFLLAAGSFVLFLIASIQAIRSIQLGNTTAIIISAVLAAATVTFAFHNVNQMRKARVPRRTAQRMRRHL